MGKKHKGSKSHKSHKKSHKSHHRKEYYSSSDCSSSDYSSSDDEHCHNSYREHHHHRGTIGHGPPGPPGPPGPLVVAIMGNSEKGLGPYEEGTYCLQPNCNIYYISANCFITINCSSDYSAYFKVIRIVENLITIVNYSNDVASWSIGAYVALVGPQGATGPTGQSLIGVTSLSYYSLINGATLTTAVDNYNKYLQLGPADGSNPGILTAEDQTIGGCKQFNDILSLANSNGPPINHCGYGDTFPLGSMYFDNTLQTVQVYTSSGWESVLSGTTYTDLVSFSLNGALGTVISTTSETQFLFITQPASVTIAYVSISYYFTSESTATISLNNFTGASIGSNGTAIVSDLFGNIGTGTINQVNVLEISGTSLTSLVSSGQSLSTSSVRPVTLSCTANDANVFGILSVTVGYA